MEQAFENVTKSMKKRMGLQDDAFEALVQFFLHTASRFDQFPEEIRNDIRTWCAANQEIFKALCSEQLKTDHEFEIALNDLKRRQNELFWRAADQAVILGARSQTV